MKHISTLPVFALTALALVIGGCGGSDGGDAAITKAEFIKQADALCKKVDEREFGEFGAWAKANDKKLVGLSTGQVEKEAIRAIVVPSVRNEIEEVKAIGIPEGDEEELEKFFDEVEVAIEKTEKNPLSAEKSRSQSPFFGSYELGRAYGFSDCAEMS